MVVRVVVRGSSGGDLVGNYTDYFTRKLLVSHAPPIGRIGDISGGGSPYLIKYKKELPKKINKKSTIFIYHSS